jgi:hypothetical protein
MDEEVQKEADEKVFLERKAEQEKKDQEKTEKNRAKREKQRARKAKQKQGSKGDAGGEKEGTPVPEGGKLKRKLAPNPSAPRPGEDDGDDAALNGGEVKHTEEAGLVIRDDDE